jgi:polyisoprenoid-binding protein YceI
MESDIFPKSSFKGNIINIKEVDFKKDGIYKVKIAGKLTMHGVTKDVNTEAKMEVKGEKITAKSEFSILLSDYNIDVPKLVKDQISNEIKIEVNNVYLPLKPVN